MLTKTPNPCLVSTLIKALVFIKNPMRPKVLYTNVSVLPALHLKARLIHIQRLIVERNSSKRQKRVGLGMCLSNHAQSVQVDCVSSRVSTKNLQEKHEYLCQKVPKSTAISWFHKAKALRHVVPDLSYAQVLAKGSNLKHTVSLGKTLKGIVKSFIKDFIKLKAFCPISIAKTDFKARDQ